MQLKQYNEILEKIKQFDFIVIDRKIVDLYPEIKSLIESKHVYLLENPELSKNINDYNKICEFFLIKNITRQSKLLAIGGGATSDLAGFVAATVLRGIEWSIIPTTLLAMIDASIGGKTGVNSGFGKNLIGAFHLPVDIWVCTDFLKTLPALEVTSGLGELLKYAFLDKVIYEYILSDAFNLSECIIQCGKFKEKIVSEDFKEGGKRKILNLGHTFGHAFEKTTKLPHGIAVYWGLKFIIDLYIPFASCDFNKIVSILQIQLEFPEKIDFKKFMQLLKMDKKKVSSIEVEFILFNGIGNIDIIKKDINNVETDIKNSSIFLDYFKTYNG